MSRDITLVELGRIELPSADVTLTALRPSPRYRLAVAGLPGQLGVATPPSGLCQMSVVLPTVNGLSRRHPPLLLPGCGGLAPRNIAARCDSLRPSIRLRERTRRRRFFFCPRLASLRQLGSHRAASGNNVETGQPRKPLSVPGLAVLRSPSASASLSSPAPDHHPASASMIFTTGGGRPGSP